ncbi:hypothetical protein PMI09_00671 [Rhizobium sp. CF122]|uniref:DUF3168 domain-containing protein n=1 Tax=Rhizobium sp. CF122 TaxID=1144312 RepID=UPI000271A021|nr:DUF3168 domain-containing protein [Rhizobium sp. CF122]EJL57966.1 hypothetical protein PMI09_00671 [Rhizobium sp. CF122]
MTSPSLELQGAIVARLRTAAALADLVGARVYDAVPPESERISKTGAAWPYVTVGEGDETSDDVDCVDGFEISLDVDVWSRATGFPQAKQISDEIRRALKSPELVLPQNVLVYFRHRQTRFLRDPDGLTSHAVMTFEAFAEQP